MKNPVNRNKQNRIIIKIKIQVINKNNLENKNIIIKHQIT